MTNSVESQTKDLKYILLKTKQELKNKDDYIKKQKTVQDLIKKEYQKLYEEYTSVKKQLQQYDAYMKTQRLEKRRKEKNELAKQKMEFERRKNEQENEISMLNEFKKLKKLNVLNEIKNKNKKHNRKYDESEEEEEEEEEDEAPKKRKKRKKTSVLDLINE